MKFPRLDETTTGRLKRIFKAAFEKNIQSKEQLSQLVDNFIVHVGTAMMVYQFEKSYTEYSKSGKGKDELESFRNTVGQLINYIGEQHDEPSLAQLAIGLLEAKYYAIEPDSLEAKYEAYGFDFMQRVRFDAAYGYDLLQRMRQVLKEYYQMLDLIIEPAHDGAPKKTALDRFYAYISSQLRQSKQEISATLLGDIADAVLPIMDESKIDMDIKRRARDFVQDHPN